MRAKASAGSFATCRTDQAKIRIITARKTEPYERRSYHEEPGNDDWSRFDALADKEVHASALADPGAQSSHRGVPCPHEAGAAGADIAPRARPDTGGIRSALSQSGSAHCAIGSKAARSARAHLKVITGDPDGVRRALEAKPG
jgi:hypothetical protein